jgi:Ca2+-transporting ATPase
MINIFLFLSLVFILTFLIGRLIEKIRVPWIFASLILGFLLAIYNPFLEITSSPTFTFLAQLGMYFLLFIIGFEIDLRKFEKTSKFILKGTFFIIFFEAFFGSLLVYFIFHYDWFISFLVALSFATVGEAVLIPILDEFKLINTKLGQSIIGIGLLDDIIEIIILILVIALISSSKVTHLNPSFILISLALLFILTIFFRKFGEEGIKFKFRSIETSFLFLIFVLFLFLGIGFYAESAPLAALLAGIGFKTFIPSKRLELIESEIRTMCYGFFAPLFFLWVGLATDINYLLISPFLIFLVILVSNGAKILGSYIIGKNELGLKRSILLGMGLSVRFSTSIIIVKILLDTNTINLGLYSVIVASSVIFTFVIPILFSNLLARWKVVK